MKSGDIFDTSRVVRIDRGLGILLELPSEPVPTPCFVGVCLLTVHPSLLMRCFSSPSIYMVGSLTDI